MEKKKTTTTTTKEKEKMMSKKKKMNGFVSFIRMHLRKLIELRSFHAHIKYIFHIFSLFSFHLRLKYIHLRSISFAILFIFAYEFFQLHIFYSSSCFAARCASHNVRIFSLCSTAAAPTVLYTTYLVCEKKKKL